MRQFGEAKDRQLDSDDPQFGELFNITKTGDFLFSRATEFEFSRRLSKDQPIILSLYVGEYLIGHHDNIVAEAKRSQSLLSKSIANHVGVCKYSYLYVYDHPERSCDMCDIACQEILYFMGIEDKKAPLASRQRWRRRVLSRNRCANKSAARNISETVE